MGVLSYRILLRKEPEGGYTVIVPSLPGCVTYGDSVEEAIDMAKEAIDLYLESLREHGEEIPTEEETLWYSSKSGGVKYPSWVQIPLSPPKKEVRTSEVMPPFI